MNAELEKLYSFFIEQIKFNFSLESQKNFFLFILLGFVIYLPLEIFYRAKKQKVFRAEWGTDFLFVFGQFLVFNSISLFFLLTVANLVKNMNLSLFHQAVASQPYWLQMLEVILLCDICIYWGHRLSHKINFLWRFHKVHHTSESLDWIAAYREHPFDNIYTRLIENLPAIILGFPLETIAGFVLFRGFWGLFIHSNVNITLGPLAWFIGSPRLHHWHHEVQSSGKCNFANLSPLMDIIFGTYHDPGKEPETYGIPQKVSHNYFRQLFDPLIFWRK